MVRGVRSIWIGLGCTAGVDDVAELAGEVFDGGPAEADGDGGLGRAAAEPDEPDVACGPAFAAGGAVIDFDSQRLARAGRSPSGTTLIVAAVC